MTYSIVAYDPEQNQLGVAVQSHSLCVGSVVPWAEAGDMRGQQSAALLVVSSQYSDRTIHRQLFNLRVDDSTEPLQDLESLLKKAKIRLHRQTAVNLLLDSSQDEGKFELAAEALRSAIDFIPNVADNPEDVFWYAITLASVGRVEDAQPILKEVFTVNPNWKEVVPRLIKVGLVSDNNGEISQLLDPI